MKSVSLASRVASESFTFAGIVKPLLVILSALFVLSGCRVVVLNEGDIGGTVTSTHIMFYQDDTVPQINCGGGGVECKGFYLQYDGQEQLIATPAPGYTFAGWSGACEGQGATCSLDVIGNVNAEMRTYHETEAHFDYTGVSLNSIPDQQLSQGFSTFTIQANASSSEDITYSVSNSHTAAVDVDIDPDSGMITLAPADDGSGAAAFGNAEIEVFATVAGGNSTSTRFSVSVAMPANPVFACGTGVETETGDTLPGSYTLFEAGQTRPLAISPNGRYLFVANTPANCLEIYNVETDTPELISSVAVGMEPVAVAARSNSEIWVVNALSDSVSVVDIRDRPHVAHTLLVGDEPRDVVFDGAGRAYITAAFRGQNHPDFTIDDLFTPGIGRGNVWVFDPDQLGTDTTLGGTPLTIIDLFTDAPRSLAVSHDGLTVYAAGYMSGNQTTSIDQESARGGKPAPGANVDGASAPATGIIVKYDGSNWVDEVGTNWSSEVNFSLPDEDIFVIDASGGTPVLAGSRSGVGTTLFNMVASPDGKLFVSNTEARNHVRFEGPGSIASTVRGNIADTRLTIIEGESVTPYHLNDHIDFDLPFGQQVSQKDKDKAIAQPGGMVYQNDELWVLAFGSNRVRIYKDPAVSSVTEWFEKPYWGAFGVYIPDGGPAGIAAHPFRDRTYVYSRFGHSLSVIDSSYKYVINTVDLFNPEPAAVVEGRKFLYDAELTSGNGTASCGSCHIFGDLDGLAWDLGNPDDGVHDNPNEILPRARFLQQTQDPKFHPMKGPMTTQTFRGMVDSGPMHWRGDRTGQNPVNGESMEAAAFKEFNGAFVGLIGRDEELAPGELQAFTDFALALTQPPNPVRNLDDSLTDNQTAGEALYFNDPASSGIPETTGLGDCNDCHELDRSKNHFGTNKLTTFEGSGISQLFKIPHLRNMYQKVGMFGTSVDNNQINETYGGGPQIKGFGYLHDGSIDTLINFFGSTFNFPGTQAQQAQHRRNVVEFSLVFDSNLKPVVGQQVTLRSDNAGVAGSRIDLLIDRALAGDCDLVAWSSSGSSNNAVSARLLTSGTDAGKFKLSAGPVWTDGQIRNQVNTTSEPVTYTCVPPGSGIRVSQVP